MLFEYPTQNRLFDRISSFDFAFLAISHQNYLTMIRPYVLVKEIDQFQEQEGNI